MTILYSPRHRQGLAFGGGQEGRETFTPQMLSCLFFSLTLSSISSCIAPNSQLLLTEAAESKDAAILLQAVSSIQQHKGFIGRNLEMAMLC